MTEVEETVLKMLKIAVENCKIRFKSNANKNMKSRSYSLLNKFTIGS